MKKNDMTFTSSQLSLLREFYSCGLSGYKFCKKKSLARSTFMHWVRIFESSNPEITERMKKKNAPQVSPEVSTIRALRLENERLRSELKAAQMCAHAYDRMIDVAEEMFNVPIRKKAGTKQ